MRDNKKNNKKINNRKENKQILNKKNRNFDNRQHSKRVVNNEENQQRNFDDQVEGRNSVLELLEAEKDINKIIGRAKGKGIVLVEVDKSKLDEISQTGNHQGVIAIVPPFEYCEVEDILEEAKNKNEQPFILILDGIEDPHNLGAIIRTAETAGVHGVVIPKRRAASVNSTVNKVSAGAVEHMKVARVNNINDTIQFLKDSGLWIIGTDGKAENYYYEQDLTGPIALVIGSEGFGMNRLVSENCDILVKIPMMGKITSLNASVSAGIVTYEIVKQRNL